MRRREFIALIGGAVATLATHGARGDAKFGVNERAIGNLLRVVYRSLPG